MSRLERQAAEQCEVPLIDAVFLRSLQGNYVDHARVCCGHRVVDCAYAVPACQVHLWSNPPVQYLSQGETWPKMETPQSLC